MSEERPGFSGEADLPEIKQNTYTDAQRNEADVANTRINEIEAEKMRLTAERMRLTTEGNTTSERTEMYSKRIAGLELQADMSHRMGDEATAEQLNNEIAQLQREKLETSDANVKQALKDLMILLPSLNTKDRQSFVHAPRCDEEMLKKMANLLNESVAYATNQAEQPRNVLMLRLSDAGDGNAVIYSCSPSGSYLHIRSHSSYNKWVNTPR